MSVTGTAMQPTLFELSRPGRGSDQVPAPPPDAAQLIPLGARRSELPRIPEVAEVDLVRHYTNLAQLNHAVDTGFYPLGSCTMKYNPRVDEWAAALESFAGLHPLAPDDVARGALRLLWEVERALSEISGFPAFTLQPAAGAHGELTGLLMVRAYHRSRGDVARDEIIVPDSAHGTNPATASMAGFKLVAVPSRPDGSVDLDAFRVAVGPRTAALMTTYPSTHGIFEPRIDELIRLTHEAGALAYMDGANLNAVLGRFTPASAGFDLMHINVHKTFGTPHGGGGPGAGPVGASAHLAPFLPFPRIVRDPDGRFRLERPGERPESIGRVRSYTASLGVLVRAYAYILAHGGTGLRQVSEDAVLAANYLRRRVEGVVDLPFAEPCTHEFVASAATIKAQTGIRTMDLAKGLIDHGVHPPTVYFPLTVEEAMLIEPTETESIETLDAFADALADVVRMAHDDPAELHEAPRTAPVRRPDEVLAARRPDLRWRPQPPTED